MKRSILQSCHPVSRTPAATPRCCRPPDLRDWVAEDDLVHFVIQAVDRLPLAVFAVNHKGCGDEQYPPHTMLALLIYCHANGIFSSRRIERATCRDVAVRHLTADTPPDHDEKILTARGIEGVLIPPHRALPHWEDFDWGRFSVVRFGLSVPSPDSNFLSGANTMSGGVVTIANNNDFVRFGSPTAGNANADWVFNNRPGRATFDFASGTIRFGSLSGNGSIQGNVSGANSYTGNTAVNAGALVVSTVSRAMGNYSVSGGATLGFTNTPGSSALVSNLTLHAGSTLEFQGVASAAEPLVLAGNVTISGPCTVRITGGDSLVEGGSHPLVTYTGALSGSLANLQLQMPRGWRGALANIGNQIVLVNVAVVAADPPRMDATLHSQQLQLTWPATHTGWRLETQTNTLNTGLGTNWLPVPGSAATNQMTFPVNNAPGGGFFRLAYP